MEGFLRVRIDGVVQELSNVQSLSKHKRHNIRLLATLSHLRDIGNTVVIIEHNLDVIKTADWIIDLGREGGAEGGYVVAAGPPERVVKLKGSYTGRLLGGAL